MQRSSGGLSDLVRGFSAFTFTQTLDYIKISGREMDKTQPKAASSSHRFTLLIPISSCSFADGGWHCLPLDTRGVDAAFKFMNAPPTELGGT